MSAWRAASAGVFARTAPPATSGMHAAAVRFHTVRAKPLSRRLRAIALPIRPRPRNATLVADAVISLTGQPEFLPRHLDQMLHSQISHREVELARHRVRKGNHEHSRRARRGNTGGRVFHGHALGRAKGKTLRSGDV